jgi:hypothetical protein
LKQKTASSFGVCCERIPLDVRNLADKNFQLLQADIYHPSLQFKRCGKVVCPCWFKLPGGCHAH